MKNILLYSFFPLIVYTASASVVVNKNDTLISGTIQNSILKALIKKNSLNKNKNECRLRSKSIRFYPVQDTLLLGIQENEEEKLSENESALLQLYNDAPTLFLRLPCTIEKLKVIKIQYVACKRKPNLC